MVKTKSKQPHTLPKTVSKTQKSEPKSKEIESAAKRRVKKIDEGSGSDSNEEEDGDEDDIDEAGIKRIIDLLGDDGLDEFAQYQLGVLGGQGSEEEDDEIVPNEESTDTQEGGDSEHEASDKPIGPSKEDEDSWDDEDEDATVTQDAVDSEVDLEGLSEVDEDVVPRQRLMYANDVSHSAPVGRKWAYILIPRTPWSEYEKI